MKLNIRNNITIRPVMGQLLLEYGIIRFHIDEFVKGHNIFYISCVGSAFWH